MTHTASKSPTEENEPYGKLPIKNSHSFVWMAGRDGEIYGHITDPDGSVLKESSGYWRTNSPEAAAKQAEVRFACRWPPELKILSRALDYLAAGDTVKEATARSWTAATADERTQVDRWICQTRHWLTRHIECNPDGLESTHYRFQKLVAEEAKQWVVYGTNHEGQRMYLDEQDDMSLALEHAAKLTASDARTIARGPDLHQRRFVPSLDAIPYYLAGVANNAAITR